MSSGRPILLSKSRFLAGLQCLKRLYLECYHGELAGPVGTGQQAIFDTGHTVGEMARRRFPGGTLVAESHLEHRQAVQTTEALLEDTSVSALYEPAFTFEGIRTRVDVLVRASIRAFDLIEVKSTASAKDEHIPDVAVQLHVVEGSGIPVGHGSVRLHPAGVPGSSADGRELPFRRRGTDLIIPAPAGDQVISLHPARVVPAGTDGRELTSRRRGFPIFVITPTGHRAVRLHSTSVEPSSAHRRELTLRRCGLSDMPPIRVAIAAPAGDRAISLHPARVEPPSAHRCELPFRRSGLPEMPIVRIGVAAPAGHRTVRLQPARVATSNADMNELPFWRRGSARIITAPAGQRAVGLHRAGAAIPSANGRELPFWSHGFAIPVCAPTSQRTIGLHPACVQVPSTDGHELRLHHVTTTAQNRKQQPQQSSQDNPCPNRGTAQPGYAASSGHRGPRSVPHGNQQTAPSGR